MPNPMRSSYLLALLFLLSCNPAASIELKSIKNKLIEKDARNKALEFHLEQKSGGILVLDIRGASGDATGLDGLRILAQLAKLYPTEMTQDVHLSFRGEPRFKISGGVYRQLGVDFETQKTGYVLRTWPEKVQTMGGQHAFPTHEGGLLFLLKVQMEDLNEFNGQWWLDDVIAETEAEQNKKLPTEYADEEAF